MKQSIGFSQFVDAFRSYDRYDNFGYDGLRVLFDYLEQLEDDTGEEIELDVIALCCDYSMSDAESIATDYRIDLTECDGDEDAIRETVLDYLNDHTLVVGEADGQIIFANF